MQYFVSYYYKNGALTGYGNITPSIEGAITENTIKELHKAIKTFLIQKAKMAKGVGVVIINIIPLADKPKRKRKKP